jgi:hypothetical protein
MSQTDEKDSVKKFIEALGDAASEVGVDGWENLRDNLVQKLVLGTGNSNGAGGETEGPSSSKKRKMKELEDKNHDIAVLDPAEVKRLFPTLESSLLRLNLDVPETTYRCETQPRAGAQNTEKDIDSIVIGLYGVIPRWKRGYVFSDTTYFHPSMDDMIR